MEEIQRVQHITWNMPTLLWFIFFAVYPRFRWIHVYNLIMFFGIALLPPGQSYDFEIYSIWIRFSSVKFLPQALLHVNALVSRGSFVPFDLVWQGYHWAYIPYVKPINASCSLIGWTLVAYHTRNTSIKGGLLFHVQSQFHATYTCKRHLRYSQSPAPGMIRNCILHNRRVTILQILGFYSLSGKTSYRKISWSLEAARFGFKLFQSLWNLAGTSAALLPRCLSNFRAIRPLQHPIPRLRDFTRCWR